MAEVKTIWQRLAEPFPPEFVHWRIGSRNQEKTRGMALAYVDARDVFDRLDQVVGPGNWQSQVVLGPEGRVAAGIGVRDETDALCWIWKWDGAGATDIEGEKGGVSDALKRAAVQHGVARYLYRLESPWVALTHDGKRMARGELEKLSEFLYSGVIPTPAAAGEKSPARSASREPGAETSDQSPDSLASKEDLKPYWRQSFDAVELVYGKEGFEQHKFEAMDYATARLGKKTSKQIRRRELVELPKLFDDFVTSRDGGSPPPSRGSEEPPHSADDDGFGGF